MGYDRAAPKRRTNLTLNESLVAQARALTPNLSDTVEQLLARFVEEGAGAEAERRRRNALHAKASAACVEQHGGWADAFSTL
ncbi:type II toxin-antitoxin system CcdA family antitoxin [Roseomonas sp. 18066]|uniref:type II toxin-antitoxin system CcdA family antitoxin n=1 Tax=Roseomonas sp. 18066 TaxID=2681412 RepID=UPI00135C37C4|nr:type II toxin-antitoxin system CcdA family antitoxin [Roseomonas sp. 18066]